MNSKPIPGTPSDDDLLANAIPIEEVEEELQTQRKEDHEPVPVVDLAEADATAPKQEIRKFDRHSQGHLEDQWKRRVNTTGQGATHVKTFVAKLRLDAIEHMDEQINQWLDEHPGFEVKFTSVSTGILTGKLREEAVFLSVWV